MQFSKMAASKLMSAFTYAILIVIALVIALPCLYMLSTAFKSQDEIYAYPVVWIPAKLMWENFPAAFDILNSLAEGMTFMRVLFNTLFITITATFGEMVAVTVSAYAYARFKFPGRKIMFSLIMASMMLPAMITMIPSFKIWVWLDRIDSFDPLMVCCWMGGGAGSIFLMRQFMLGIHREMEEAAEIDGANTFQIYYRIILPLVKPAILALGVFVFQANWNNFTGPLIYINTPQKMPLTIAMKFFTDTASGAGGGADNSYWQYIMAMSMVMALPVLAMFFAAQKYFIEGLNVGGVKG